MEIKITESAGTQVLNKTRIMLMLGLTFIIFAVLISSVSTVIFQVINNYGVNKASISALEGLNDISIIVVSFAVASFLPSYGYRKAMMTGLAVVGMTCLVMPLVPGFLMAKLMFLATGVSFALVKVSVYSTIGLITDSRTQHASTLNIVEGLFMVGVLFGYWLFSAFIGAGDPSSDAWLNVYWVIAAACALNVALWVVTPLDETGAHEEGSQDSKLEEFKKMLALVKLPMVYVFVFSIFLYVLVEQGVGSWLPTFNNQILKLPVDMSIQATSIFAACLAAGRLSAGAVLSRVHWYKVINICLVAIVALIVLALPLAEGVGDVEATSWLHVSPAAYVFPLIGFFMAPIYPAVNSVMLSAIPKHRHAPMTGLIVIFSALGGTTGSLLTGLAFEELGGQTAFYLTIIPLAGIMVALFFFRRMAPDVQS